jgi:hypothetical protein
MADIQVFKFGKRGEDQRLWVEDGKVFVFDWSGDNPKTTDDGPLEVKPGAVCTLSIWTSHVEVRVPVYSHRRDESDLWCSMSLKCFEQMSKLLPGITLNRGSKYAALGSEILRAESLALAMAHKES